VPRLSLSGRLPAGVSFRAGAHGYAIISGTPPEAAGGAYNVVLTASNSLGRTSQALLILIDGPPEFTSPHAASARVGRGFTFEVSTSGWPHPALDYTGRLMSGLTVTIGGDGDAAISGAPAGSGRSTLIFTATNRFGRSVQALAISVKN
jgi:hypothetical protein